MDRGYVAQILHYQGKIKKWYGVWSDWFHSVPKKAEAFLFRKTQLIIGKQSKSFANGTIFGFSKNQKFIYY